MCISIRWVGNDYTIYEDLMQVPKADAETL